MKTVMYCILEGQHLQFLSSYQCIVLHIRLAELHGDWCKVTSSPVFSAYNIERLDLNGPGDQATRYKGYPKQLIAFVYTLYLIIAYLS